MTYVRNLGQATSDILALPDVRAGITDPSNGLNDDYVRASIREMSDQIFQAAASHIESFEIQERHVQAARNEFAKATVDPTDISVIGGLFGLAVLGLFFGVPIALAVEGASTTWSFFVSLATNIPVAAAAIVLVSAGAARLYYYHRYQSPRLRALLTDRLQLNTGDEQVNARKELADGVVRDEVLKSVLGLIANASRPLFQDRLIVPEAPGAAPPAPYKSTTGRGLSEVVNSENEVPTAVYHDLLQTFENLPGASIGICGPRGAGKSTLLWSICRANRPVAGREAIAVYMAAPVEYETRDFMLHIFSCVCQQVLKTKRVEDDRSIPLDHHHGDNTLKLLLARQSPLGWLLICFGVAAIVLSLFLAAIVWDAGRPDRPGTAATPAASQPSPAAAGQSATDGSATSPASPPTAQPSASPTPSPTASPSPSQAPGAVPLPGGPPSTGKSYMDTLEVKPGPLLLWGIVAIVVGCLFVVLEKLSQLTARYAGGADVPFPLKLFIRQQTLAPAGDPLILQTRAHLSDIRFQRSYSSGWSGALKIPAGFESGLTLGTSLAQKQESLPELVDRFRGYVESITREYSRLIIGIDELDKLKSESSAREFVNDIKAIFNIPNCFYLMSVSENAISNFERRGMPFRDEFDSAFDDIRRIDYLTLDGSRHLLGRRVLGLPEAFLCLCYVLSAGLPRDLIRVARAMLDYAKMHPGENSIKEVAEALITTEVSKKIRAIEIAARDIAIEPERTAFLRSAAELRDFQPQSVKILSSGKLTRRKDLSPDEVVNLRKLTELQRELNAYLYYSSTTAQFFARHQSEHDWRDAIRSGFVRDLAEARQSFELNIGVVEARLDELRRTCNMPARIARRGKAGG
jgi:energy-coupling factor transporter ATP-binding protein EcfA2